MLNIANYLFFESYEYLKNEFGQSHTQIEFGVEIKFMTWEKIMVLRVKRNLL